MLSAWQTLQQYFYNTAWHMRSLQTYRLFIVYNVQSFIGLLHGELAEPGLMQQSWKLSNSNVPWVRIPHSPPYTEGWQSQVYCTSLLKRHCLKSNHEFESHTFLHSIYTWPVSQVVKTSLFHSEYGGFNSPTGHHSALIYCREGLNAPWVFGCIYHTTATY